MNKLLKKMKPQPSGSTWTAEQWQAITIRGENVLVAAAAGSGKTAVLVNRLIERLVDEEDNLDVDRLLVVTFTNAAAAEMRKRIGQALEQTLQANPGSEHIQKQLNLLPRASISTLHSFCLEVVRRYYYQLDLDPKFRIADETEAILLREEVLEELFEEQYSGSDAEAFYALVDRYSSDRSDMELQELVLHLYNFSRSHPQPERWLERMVASYRQAEDCRFISELPWAAELIEEIGRQLQACLNLVQQALSLTNQPGGPVPYLETMEEECHMIETLLLASKGHGQQSQCVWENLYQLYQQHNFGRLKSVKKGEADPELQEKVKEIREQYKKQWTELKETYFLRSPEDYLQDIREMAPYLERLIGLVHQFATRYEEQKRSKLMVDFADLEHYCLRILQTPSAALEYQQKFEEVLVDEYQDTNLVQEAIIDLVSRGSGSLGNRFMVGDVKQSIYRFRLAEPSLFLAKYRGYTPVHKTLQYTAETPLSGESPPSMELVLGDSLQPTGGIRIDLAKNFRSRHEVLAATNFIFKQVMDEQVGEMAYGPEEELVFGATTYPPTDNCQAELMLIERSKEAVQGQVEVRRDDEETETMEENGAPGQEEILAQEELETVQLEARLMAQKIKALLGETGGMPFLVYDKKEEKMRPATYKDMVILLRSTSNWAPIILEELKAQGIPAYAELQSGYFEAIEVSVMLSLLQVIDNPEQDIPLAAVLRSPLVGLRGEELAQIRLGQKRGTFFGALKTYLEKEQDKEHEQLYARLTHFYEKLKEWRTRARQGALSALIWQIYRETGYYDFVGSMSGGNQRQANLRALYNRARQYEQTSFRGLFRFLRFIEKMKDRGGDLGTARALGEQEDVVRVMTIHKSKGLEFPIVFVAGLAKQFNQRDLYQKFLLHKQLGLGTKFVDPELRVTYHSLPQLAIKQRLRMELLAEEMRILYVALTRAQEKLFLIGTVKELEKVVDKWLAQCGQDSWLLPDYERSKAVCYLDWIGPALMRHRAGGELCQDMGIAEPAVPQNVGLEVHDHPAQWKISILEASQFQHLMEEEEQQQQGTLLQALEALQPLPPASGWTEEIDRRLSWQYPYQLAERFRAKQTVTELKRQREARDEATDDQLLRQTRIFRAPLVERPRFLQQERLTAAELGTAMHLVMQHIDVSAPITLESIQQQIDRLVGLELLTPEQAAAVEAERFLPFFQSELGLRMQKSRTLHREIPFSLAVSAQETYNEWRGKEEQERVLVQGVIDAVFEEDGELILVDYKSDNIQELLAADEEKAGEILRQRYRVQIELYEQALEQIWKRKVRESYVYFFDGNFCLAMHEAQEDE